VKTKSGNCSNFDANALNDGDFLLSGVKQAFVARCMSSEIGLLEIDRWRSAGGLPNEIQTLQLNCWELPGMLVAYRITAQSK
jgi:hypothetical protein